MRYKLADAPSRMNNWRGPALMVGQQACFAVETSAIHWFGHSLSVTQLALLRAFGGLLLVACLLPRAGLAVLRTNQLKLQIGRGLVGVGYLVVLVFSLANLPLADASALSYTVALYIPVFGYLILKERFTWEVGVAAIIGFVGALVLIKPSLSFVSVVYLIVLVGTSLNALSYVLNRHLQQLDRSETVMFYTNAISCLAFAPALVQPWPSDAASVAMMLPILVLGPLGMFVGIIAVRIHPNIASLAPYTYTRLIPIGFIAPLLFGEPLTARLIIGSLLIVTACLLASSPSSRTR